VRLDAVVRAPREGGAAEPMDEVAAIALVRDACAHPRVIPASVATRPLLAGAVGRKTSASAHWAAHWAPE
jgi:hypothetical protein